MSFEDQPQFQKVGKTVGRYIIWDDGSPPTLLPEDQWEPDTKPADPACQSEVV